MVWQSMISMVYFLEAFLTDVLVVLVTIDVCSPTGRSGEWLLICTGLEALLPLLVSVFKAIDTIKDLVLKLITGIQKLLKGIDPDKWIGTIVIPGHRMLNQGLAALSQ